MSLVEVALVRTRLDQLQGFVMPEGVTPERLEEYVRTASGELLARAGRATPPTDGTVARAALNNLCLDLVVNRVLHSLFVGQPEMRESLARELDQLLARAEAFALREPERGSAFVEVVGGS